MSSNHNLRKAKNTKNKMNRFVCLLFVCLLFVCLFFVLVWLALYFQAFTKTAPIRSCIRGQTQVAQMYAPEELTAAALYRKKWNATQQVRFATAAKMPVGTGPRGLSTGLPKLKVMYPGGILDLIYDSEEDCAKRVHEDMTRVYNDITRTAAAPLTQIAQQKLQTQMANYRATNDYVIGMTQVAKERSNAEMYVIRLCNRPDTTCRLDGKFLDVVAPDYVKREICRRRRCK